MGRAKIGTGQLTPFKKSSTGSTSIGGSTDDYYERKGFTKKVTTCEKASRNVTKLEPFKTGPTGPGRATTGGGVPQFRKRDNGIPKMPPPFKP